MADNKFKKELLDYLARPHTHAPLARAAKGFPAMLINKKLRGVPYTPWQLLEHIRIAQHDMLEFIQNPDYEEMEWPKDYWPDAKQKATTTMWNTSLAACEKDLKALEAIVKNPRTSLLGRIPWGNGQTVLREVLQVIDHAAYHTGELVLMRRAMGKWK